MKDEIYGMGGYVFGALAADEMLDDHANPESMIRSAFEFWCKSDNAKNLFAMGKREFLLKLEQDATSEGLANVTPWARWDADPNTGIREDSDIDLTNETS